MHAAVAPQYHHFPFFLPSTNVSLFYLLTSLHRLIKFIKIKFNKILLQNVFRYTIKKKCFNENKRTLYSLFTLFIPPIHYIIVYQCKMQINFVLSLMRYSFLHKMCYENVTSNIDPC